MQPIDCQGRKFDPRRMNAVDVEETEDAEEGTVVSVYRMGYEWNGELFVRLRSRWHGSKERCE